MDQLTIGDKIYISSKRAAETTGYAKDYVGQLCREGRVEARLVGRSWYVLETAIKDHRFGTEGAHESNTLEKPSVNWEPARYNAQEVEPMPLSTEQTSPNEAWGEWFNRVPEATLDAEIVPEAQNEPVEPIRVPIRSIVHPPLEASPRAKERLESFDMQVQPQEREVVREEKDLSSASALYHVAAAILVVISFAAVTIGIVGSGLVDFNKYNIDMARSVAGVSLYSK